MTGNSYTVLNAMTDIVAAPATALDEIRQHTAWLWWPLLISMLLAAGMFVYYYSWVDFDWLIEETIRQVPAESRAASAEAIRSFMQPGRTLWITVAGVVVMTFVIYTLQATYLHLANKLTSGTEIGFGQWFSFSVWTGFVSVFGALAAFVVILMADSNQLNAESLQVFSINSILLHANPGDPWYKWASSLTLINFWILFLVSIGYARWTGASRLKSTIIAVLPWALIFGVWALRV